MKNQFKRFLKISLSYGLKEAIFDVIIRCCKKFSYKKRYYRIEGGYDHPICLRFDTSDFGIFEQVFLRKEYACMDDAKDPKLIIDAGANIGLTSLYFLNQFPLARVICIEPDSTNFDILKRNLAFYRDRVTLIKSGVWSKPTGLTVVTDDQYGGGESGIYVRECGEGQRPDITAVTVDALLNQTHFNEIDILKLDIEKAEAEIFKNNYHDWLPKVKNIAIELHNEECEVIFFNALKGYTYELGYSGELTTIKNLTPCPS